MTKNLEADQKKDEEMKDKFVCALRRLCPTARQFIAKDCWCKKNNKDKKEAIAAAQQSPQLIATAHDITQHPREKLASLTALVQERLRQTCVFDFQILQVGIETQFTRIVCSLAMFRESLQIAAFGLGGLSGCESA